MDLHHFLRTRRSIRRFKPIPVSLDILTRILETAMYAPSAHNRQPWRFTVITDEINKTHLSLLMTADFHRDLIADGLGELEIETRINRSKNRIINAPVIIILCMDMSEMDVFADLTGSHALAERTMAIQSVASAGLQLQLAAHAEGLASVWTCSPLFAQSSVRLALDLPENWEPQAMFFLGYSSEPPKEKRLKTLEEVVKFLV
ncbi:MAG: nitroreductase family protein [Chloroflexi bacterium]|nr:nitroreductase family protein [Chloroflexota bacterium]